MEVRQSGKMEGAITSNIHRMGSQSLVLFKRIIAPNIWQPDHDVDDKIIFGWCWISTKWWWHCTWYLVTENTKLWWLEGCVVERLANSVWSGKWKIWIWWSPKIEHFFNTKSLSKVLKFPNWKYFSTPIFYQTSKNVST